MTVKFYYNIASNKSYEAYNNFKIALNSLKLNANIEYIPTGHLSSNRDCIYFAHQLLTHYYSDNLLDMLFELFHTTIVDNEEIVLLRSGLDLNLEDVKILPLMDGEEVETTLVIGEVKETGVNLVSYYEFALSCFYVEERDEIIEIECFCNGKYCG